MHNNALTLLLDADTPEANAAQHIEPWIHAFRLHDGFGNIWRLKLKTAGSVGESLMTVEAFGYVVQDHDVKLWAECLCYQPEQRAAYIGLTLRHRVKEDVEHNHFVMLVRQKEDAGPGQKVTWGLGFGQMDCDEYGELLDDDYTALLPQGVEMAVILSVEASLKGGRQS